MERRSAHRTLRPAGVSPPALWLLVLAAGAFAIAGTTGAGWLLVLVAGLVGVAVTAVLLPPVLLHRVQVEVQGPRDARVGDPCPLTITLTGPSIVALVGVRSELRSTTLPIRGLIPFVPPVRGRLEEVDVVLESAAPLGLVSWRRVVRAAFAVPPLVAPHPVFDSVPPTPAAPATEDAPARGPEARGHQLQRGVREYEAGDPPRLIHWPATAHTGGLMVREVEAPGIPTQVILVDLRRGTSAEIEHAVSRAFGLVLTALDAGACVHLGTFETEGPRLRRITTRIGAGRRLAVAASGPPPSLPVTAPGTVVVVSPQSDIRP
ncbi:MAG: DUF58 domain-containing protein [Acidimicrobiia bacterium]|nr:DUF58 domain-containing protein [Acidimicrobiia bacterium]